MSSTVIRKERESGKAIENLTFCLVILANSMEKSSSFAATLWTTLLVTECPWMVVHGLQQKITGLSVAPQHARETHVSCSGDACWLALSHHVVGECGKTHGGRVVQFTGCVVPQVLALDSSCRHCRCTLLTRRWACTSQRRNTVAQEV